MAIPISLDEKLAQYCWDISLELMNRRIEAGLPAGGVSRLREKQARQKFLLEDAWVGNLGAYALTRYITGSDYLFREHQNRNSNPGQGDGGCDIPWGQYQVDVKSSLWRYKNLKPEGHNLLVRPKERHSNSIYVFVLVEGGKIRDQEIGSIDDLGAKVWLVGWAWDFNLPSQPFQDGALKGAYGIQGKNLFAIPELQKQYRNLYKKAI